MKNKMWSKKTLIPWLIEKGFISGEKYSVATGSGEDIKGVSYEAYGKKVCAFISVKDMAARTCLELLLKSEGQKVDRDYWPGKPVVCVQVTFFKAWHWDE
jgi:hypothetical protein